MIDFYGISGRSRKKQIDLAKKFRIKYPSPAGGCLLCEKILKNRLNFLIKRGLNYNEINLVGIGRHFIIDKFWIVLGRNDKENKFIESSKAGKIIEPNYPAPSVLIISKFPLGSNFIVSRAIIKKVKELIKAYSKQGSLDKRKKFDKWKL